MDLAIQVTNVSKQYRLGQVGTGTLRNDLNRLWHQLLGKEDPYLRIGQENDRTRKAEMEYVWALQDINFKVEQGEVLGIIGRNGAGKSTLLKILSKITAPTTGEILINGRIASLLEVGTGFHPELTGRENIFLNGAILGMRKFEIQRKFDDIVDFSGVAAYIDTPVKRYSSGMYVRLAFAVSAFLESEILVVDEVLAVGDAEFQQKCLGRMKDVSSNLGKTVLFVSHNMAAIQNLCTKGLLLQNGRVEMMDELENVLIAYNSKLYDSTQIVPNSGKPVFLMDLKYYKKDHPEMPISTGCKAVFEFLIYSEKSVDHVVLGIGINDYMGTRVITPFSLHDEKSYTLKPGENLVYCEIPFFSLKPGTYNAEIYVGTKEDVFDYYNKGIKIVIETVEKGIIRHIPTATQGAFIIDQKWY